MKYMHSLLYLETTDYLFSNYYIVFEKEKKTKQNKQTKEKEN